MWKDFINLCAQKGHFQPISRKNNPLFMNKLWFALFLIINVSFPSSSPIPQLVFTPPSIREIETHLPPPQVIGMLCQRVCVPHSEGFGGSPTRPAALIFDTCQCLGCRPCAEMEMSRSDTTCQR